MHSHRQYAANLVKRTTAQAIFDLAWDDPEPDQEETTPKRRRRSATDTQEAAGLRELHDTVMLYGGDPKGPVVQGWGAKLAEAAGIEASNRPVTWALALAPLLAEIPEVLDVEASEPQGEVSGNGHLVSV